MRATFLLVAVSLVGALGACSAGDTTPAHEVPAVYKKQIDDLLADNPSASERDVFKDYWVSDAEYAQAQESVRACLTDKDYDVLMDPKGGMAVGDPRQDRPTRVKDADVDTCERGILPTVETMYAAQQQNPKGLSLVQGMQDCLAKWHVTNALGMSDDELLARIQSDGEFLLDTDEGRACRTNVWAAPRATSEKDIRHIITFGE